MWTTLPFEISLEQALKSSPSRGFGESRGAEIFGWYLSARGRLVREILPYISREEPDLTTHDATHVENVMNNISDLLGEEINTLSGAELYCLAVSALFHDVGNLYGRAGHRDKLHKIYWDVRDKNTDFSQEKTVVSKIIRAHTGPARDGTPDTLKDLKSDEQLLGRKVRVVILAALLRFADELAEGAQRTSAYILKKHGFREGSEIYHQYARYTQICINRDDERIVLTYNVHLHRDGDRISGACEQTIKKMLNFIYERVLKLDQERRYNKHYCDLLQSFKFCRVQINFHLDELEIESGLEPIILSDKIIPGQKENSIPEQDPQYNPDRMWERLLELSAVESPLEFPSQSHSQA